MRNSCTNCRFFEHKNSFCRRFPPIVVVEDRHANNSNYVPDGNTTEQYSKTHNAFLTKFPVIVRPDVDWCGEWKDGDAQESYF